MKRLTHEERFLLGLISLFDRTKEELAEIWFKTPGEVELTIESINKKVGNVIKSKDSPKKYFIEKEGADLFETDLFEELKSMKHILN